MPGKNPLIFMIVASSSVFSAAKGGYFSWNTSSLAFPETPGVCKGGKSGSLLSTYIK